MLESCGHAAIVNDADYVADIAALHERCGVYTSEPMVGQILDAIGWTTGADLLSARFLEPSAGDGAFVVEAVRRLLASYERAKVPLTQVNLAPRIMAFELHEAEGNRCRERVADILVRRRFSRQDADLLAAQWITIGDFLLAEFGGPLFTHIAGNPPYVRWSKIPLKLRRSYEAKLPKYAAKGDLFLPFLNRGIDLLGSDGRLGFICSNRWKFMAFAEDFRRRLLGHVNILTDKEIAANEAYQRSVDAYPSMLILERRPRIREAPAVKRAGQTLDEAGFQVRVGPALGCTAAYVLDANEADVEDELLVPWLTASNIGGGQVVSAGQRVICLYDDSGRLRDLSRYPRLQARLLRFKERLEQRSIVRDHNAPWFRTIDRVYASAWEGPKLLVPGLSKSPCVAFDKSGAIPSHGVYAIMAKDPRADLDALRSRLSNGGLAKLIEGHAPKVKGGYIRCYKGILARIIL